MSDKPQHLTLQYAEQFKDQAVVEAYRYRPPLPDEVFDVLLRLIVDRPRVVLDAGCGSGAVARQLAPQVDRVDAVDFSHAMIEVGKQLPGGNDPHLNWIEGAMEAVALEPPYALVVSSASLHWMEWDVVVPRFRSLLTPKGVMAIVHQSEAPQAWHKELYRLISQYSTNRDYRPYNLVDELATRGLFQKVDEEQTTTMLFQQSIADYVESIHSRNGFSRERMTPDAARAFDAGVTQLLNEAFPDGVVRIEIVGHVIWGV